MARLNTFYLAPARWREPFCLDGEEGHHLVRVLRAKAGDTIRLMDGQGRAGLFRIVAINKKDALLDLVSEQTDQSHAAGLTLAVGWSKGLRRGYLLEKAVELGAGAIWFWQARHSQGAIPDDAQEVWIRQLISAAKQCGASRLPEIRTFGGPAEVIQAAQGKGGRILCWEREQVRLLQPDHLAHSTGAIAVLGPEGGLDDTEADLFMTQGFIPITLGPRILRFETAAIFVLSLGMWMTNYKITQNV